MKRLRFGLQARALLVLSATFLLVGAILGLLMSRQSIMQAEVRSLGDELIGELYEQNARERGQGIAFDLAESLVNPLYYNDIDQVEQLLRGVSVQPVVSYVRVVDQHGGLIHDGSADVLDVGLSAPDLLAEAAVLSDLPLIQRLGDVLDISAPIILGEQRLGFVRVGMNLGLATAQRERAGGRLQAGIDELGKRHLFVGFVLLALLILAGVAVMLYVQRTLVRPIRDLASAARQIESGDYEVALCKVPGNNEMGDLVRTFGRMTQAIARHDREVRQLAYTDSLTGLTNRMAFRETLEQRILLAQERGNGGKAARMALLFIDVDDFKRVNDTMGHEAGDEVLLGFVERINEAVAREGGPNALVARFGGDEFVLLVDDEIVAERATRLAEILVAELARPLIVEEREIFLGTSIGITLFPDDASDATGLIKNGDIAMYQAKLGGKNGFRYYSRAMDHAVERQLQMEQELRGAWERGELHLVFQPIYRMTDKVMVGAEVLLRWQHPQMGAIPPSVFIPVAEKTGLIEQLGPKVLRAACMEARRWGQVPGGERLFISVNVSARQLRSSDMAALVVRSLQESGLAPSRLHIELTETAVMADEMLAATLLEKLHRHGVKVWLDDFGTGFSGLSHLRQVPVDGVKIDKSFVADMQRDPDDLALTSAIIAMCHALGITVVAEGIEQEAQFELLAMRKCNLAQGYWLSRPMTSTQLMNKLQIPA